MKFKIGDKVRVKSGLKEEQLSHFYLETYREKLENRIFTIASFTLGGYYMVKETLYALSEEMLEPLEETFNVGDVVYDESGERVEIVEYFYRVKYDDGTLSLKRESKLSKTKPLQKITREALAEKGYELVD